MPPWITALLALIFISALGAYIVYGEGFDTARTLCNRTFNTCTRACSSNDQACFTICTQAQTKCLSNAVAAATIINDGPLNRRYMTSNMAWAASLGSGLLGNSNTGSNRYMEWKNSAGSSTSISVYDTDTTRVYRQVGWDSSLRGSTTASSTSKTPSSTGKSSTGTPSTSSTGTPSTSSTSSTSSTLSSSAWDGNRNTYTTGWRHPSFDFEDEGSYDANSPVEGSYVVNVKRWKPHETPTQESQGVRVSAPTDVGTMADELRDEIPSLQQNVRYDTDVSNDIVPDTIRELIREDVKDTMDGLFRNQYEIKYN